MIRLMSARRVRQLRECAGRAEDSERKLGLAESVLEQQRRAYDAQVRRARTESARLLARIEEALTRPGAAPDELPIAGGATALNWALAVGQALGIAAEHAPEPGLRQRYAPLCDQYWMRLQLLVKEAAAEAAEAGELTETLRAAVVVPCVIKDENEGGDHR